ncbi:MAG: hypothetical protein Q9227_005809 [Pyrenula ochraceoflavens]
MPHLAEEEDPVVGTFDVYLTSPNGPDSQDSLSRQTMMLLQYPERKSKSPYSESTHQKPSSLRLKPKAGLVEVDVPIDTQYNYNADRGEKYGDALRRSRILNQGGAHGLSGGFNTAHSYRSAGPHDPDDATSRLDLKSIALHGSSSRARGHDTDYSAQHALTLGGKIKKPTDGDPIYMLGRVTDDDTPAIHLTPLDALVQLSPQLPHLDALDEAQRARASGENAAARLRREAGGEGSSSSKPAARAVNMRIKGVEIDPERDRKDQSDALLMRIQEEKWTDYSWVDHDDIDSTIAYDKCLRMPSQDDAVELKASIENWEWLDAMSAPRVDPSGGRNGAMGLLAKVKGREREKQRKQRSEKKRKEQEAQPEPSASKQVNNTDQGEDMVEDEEDSVSDTGSDESLPEERDEEPGDRPGRGDSDVEMVDPPPARQTSKGKGKAPAKADMKKTEPAPSQSRKPRGRPRKSANQDTIVID